ncbi:MAG: sugar phosphate isomerase/epimerase [Spirochaetales bacterium]|nr:sugar phosphate isomerase/epimerase [Spirochaetales bacterium]
MKVGIDSYCFHRLFGEVYDDQKAPSKNISMEWFIKRAAELGVDGVSLESCFFPSFAPSYLSEVKGMLDEYNFDRVYAWGHPDGLEGGYNEAAFDDMMQHMEYAEAIGADVMRVCGASLMFRFKDHEWMINTLTRMFQNAMPTAEKKGIKIANENHIDFNADEMLRIIHQVNSPNFGINFDTGNFMRVLDDPVEGMKKLAKYTFSTHVKDLKPQANCGVGSWHFFACTPTGEGLVDNLKLAQLLKDADYQGFLAMEIDYLHEDNRNDWSDDDENKAVEASVKELKRIAGIVG